MKAYLAGPEQQLRVGQEPMTVSVGAVVWNINHLKAGKKVVSAVGGEAKSANKYNADKINASLDKLVKAFSVIAGPLGTAINKETKKLEKKDPEKTKSARSELSQLETDIKVLSQGGFAKVVTEGIAALNRGNVDDGTSTIEARAEWLRQIRKLNRVWKRVKRLRSFLSADGAKSGYKGEARTSIRNAATADQWAPITEANGELRASLPIEDLETAVTDLKRETVLELTTSSFFKSTAVNLVLINEMNLGITDLEKAVQGKGVDLSQGPKMAAQGKMEGERVVAKQHEYYPAVYRKDGENAVKAAGTFYVATDGTFAVQGKADNNQIPWNKRKASFRGIVVHRFSQGGQEFWAGVLHTTPAGKDLDRTEIWPQIEKPLAVLNELACHFGIPLLVGGDFYISAEGIVNKPVGGQKKEIRTAESAPIESVKWWNSARNIFLAAAAEEDPNKLQLDTLLQYLDNLLGNENLPNKKKAGSNKKKKRAKVKKGDEGQSAFRAESFKPERLKRWEKEYRDKIVQLMGEKGAL